MLQFFHVRPDSSSRGAAFDSILLFLEILSLLIQLASQYLSDLLEMLRELCPDALEILDPLVCLVPNRF
jgi:hypothetical protein